MKNLLKPRTEIDYFGLNLNSYCQKCLCGSDWFSIYFFEMDLFLRLVFFFPPLIFSELFCTHIFCKGFEFLTSTNIFPNLWGSNYFCSWSYIIFNKGIAVSQIIQTSSTLSCMSSKKRVISWNLSNHFGWSLIKKTIFRNHAEQENNLGKFCGHKRNFLLHFLLLKFEQPFRMKFN